MTILNVSELAGALLDYWVARAEGYSDRDINWRKGGDFWIAESFDCGFLPSTDWAHGGPIIEREGVELWPDSAIDKKDRAPGVWYAALCDHEAFGNTPLEAAMRVYVASKFGNTVTDEESK